MKTMKEQKKDRSKIPHEKDSEAKKSSKPVKGTNKGNGKLGQILGHSVVSVIRTMGKAGWQFDDAKAALDKAKIQAADHTIRVGLKRGRDGDKTRRIAPLSAKQLGSLKAK